MSLTANSIYCKVLGQAQRARALARRFAHDRKGAVAVFVAAALVPMVAAVGVAVDGARGYLVKSRLSQALDAAALAGGRVIYDATRDDDIRMYFKANFPNGYLQATVSDPTIEVDANMETITLNGQATLPTSFMRVLGFDTITIKASATITRTNQGMELVLVMDNTGSMASGGKIDAMKNAAAELVNILYGSNDTMPNLYVSLVPYVAMVNIGSANVAWTSTTAYPLVSVTSMTRTTNASTSSPQTSTVCATTATAHLLPTQGFAMADVAGASNSVYNGRFVVHAGVAESTTGCTINAGNAATTFWYLIDTTSGGASASGTITAQGINANYSPAAWKGCVEARNSPYEEANAEALPATATFVRSYWASTRNVKFYKTNKNLQKDGGASGVLGDNNWGVGASPQVNEAPGASNAYGPNLACGPAITPLQPNKSVALAAISAMYAAPAAAGTMGNMGLAWGWRVLSPDWRGMWTAPTPPTLPLDYGTPLMGKIIVMLTDGVNQWYDRPSAAPGCSSVSSCGMPSDADYTAYGRLSHARLGTTDGDTATDVVNTRMTQLCASMKAKGVTIYTIVLQENDAATQALYQGCASKPQYAYVSPSSAELNGIFTQIAQQLSKLHLSR